MRRRGLYSGGSWDGTIENIALEQTIADVNIKWGVSKTAWSTRFSNDKTKFFIGDSGSSSLNYSLNRVTPNINDWTLASQGIAAQMRSIHISSDGTKLFGNIFSLSQWTLSTPFDLSTATSNGTFATPDWIYGCFLDPTGTKLILSIGNATDKMYEYDLSTPFNVLSGVGAVQNVSLGFEPRGLCYYNNGNNFLVIDGSSKVYKCDVSSPYTLDGIVTTLLFDAAILLSTGIGSIANVEMDEQNNKIYMASAQGKLYQIAFTN